MAARKIKALTRNLPGLGLQWGQTREIDDSDEGTAALLKTALENGWAGEVKDEPKKAPARGSAKDDSAES